MNLESVRIVLVETSHPGNIGAAARAMKNMGLSRLYLVNPSQFPHTDASARASGADDVLANAVVCRDLNQAIADCNWVVGTSARERHVDWPTISPRQWAQNAIEKLPENRIAVVFGRERSGLSNAEMDLCQQLLHIPCNPAFSSLNIGAAVQVISYELFSQLSAPIKSLAPQDLVKSSVSSAEMETFFEHMEASLLEIGFFKPPNFQKLQRRLRKFFFQAQPDKTELDILHGILSAAEGRKYQWLAQQQKSRNDKP